MIFIEISKTHCAQLIGLAVYDGDNYVHAADAKESGALYEYLCDFVSSGEVDDVGAGMMVAANCFNAQNTMKTVALFRGPLRLRQTVDADCIHILPKVMFNDVMEK